jgi:oxygen-independent coproporphyrinogen III oxidase
MSPQKEGHMPALLHTPPRETAPRYTSYPTAPHFHAGIGDADLRHWLGSVADDEALSLYVHIPFCDRLCWFCACHTRHTLRYEPVAAYLDALLREMELVKAALGGRGGARTLHFGGGSPTMLSPRDLERVASSLRAAFAPADDLRIGIEIDPNDIDEPKLDAIAAIGATRASLGIQDFDPKVQRAINRMQSLEQTQAVVAGLRARAIDAINLDLVYGLPHQTTPGVVDTVARCIELAPDRIALFGYAHVPWFKKHQTMIDEAWLPDADARLEQATAAQERILEAGYVAIGIDHFAWPDDPLAIALARGELRRNFQGYSDDGCQTLIGLGPSSIGRYRQGHAQNTTSMGEYVRSIEAGSLPIARGVCFSEEDRVRGWLIERLMCEFGFSGTELEARHGAGGRRLLVEAEGLAGSMPDMLVRDGDRFFIPPQRRMEARRVAARFDAYLGKGQARHSAVV